MQRFYFLLCAISYLLFGQPLLGAAQFTAIPDTTFERYLITSGIDSDGLMNGQIATADAAAATTINIVGQGQPGMLRSLAGIEDFSSLTILVCTTQRMDSLDLRNNTNLQVVNVSNNSLTKLQMDGLVNLRELNCNNNQLPQINLSTNINLETLIINSNVLDSIDISQNSSLLTFIAAYNTLSQIDLSNQPLLTELNLAGNLLSTIDLSQQSNLLHLFLELNTIPRLDLSNNQLLERLVVYNNLLDSLDLSVQTKLELFYCYNNQLTNLDLSNCFHLKFLQGQNNDLERLNLHNGNNASIATMLVQGNAGNLIICVDSVYNVNNTWAKDDFATYSFACEPNVRGVFALDQNVNCVVESNEPRLSYQFLQVSSATDTLYATSNQLGQYQFGLQTGNYTLNALPISPYWTPCPNPQQLQVDSLNDRDTINWSMDASTLCPYLLVDLGAPFLRATGGGSSYTVSYCNLGTLAAHTPYVEVTLDTFLTFLGSSIPVSSQQGNVYTFQLDTLEVGACGAFNLLVVVDTAAQVGQTHCSQAHIFPDSNCANIWTGAVINAKGNCQQDTVFFILKNTGGNMQMAQAYTIFEDDIIIRLSPFNLSSGDSMVIAQAAKEGSTYRIEAHQDLGYPSSLGMPFIHAVVEGCNPTPNGNFNTGFVLQYYTGNSSPHVAVDCQPSIAAYDPNDKMAQPVGYGNQHYITANTPLRYRIRFQNTGNDTAFNIVIIDTLSEHLHIPSLQMGSSSHPYTWELREGHILELRFTDIKLVDSTTNEPLSHGFFHYSILPKSTLADGIVINNRATIYFDYNAPIFTNTSFHTIGEDFIRVPIQTLEAARNLDNIAVYPNPTQQQLYIDNLHNSIHLIALYDQLGQVVLEQTAGGGIEQLNLAALPAGLYYLRLSNNQQQAIKKIIKQ